METVKQKAKVYRATSDTINFQQPTHLLKKKKHFIWGSSQTGAIPVSVCHRPLPMIIASSAFHSSPPRSHSRPPSSSYSPQTSPNSPHTPFSFIGVFARRPARSLHISTIWAPTTCRNSAITKPKPPPGPRPCPPARPSDSKSANDRRKLGSPGGRNGVV